MRENLIWHSVLRDQTIIISQILYQSQVPFELLLNVLGRYNLWTNVTN